MKIFKTIKESSLSLSQAVSSIVEKAFMNSFTNIEKVYHETTIEDEEYLSTVRNKDKMIELIVQKKDNQPFYKHENKKNWE